MIRSTLLVTCLVVVVFCKKLFMFVGISKGDHIRLMEKGYRRFRLYTKKETNTPFQKKFPRTIIGLLYLQIKGQRNLSNNL